MKIDRRELAGAVADIGVLVPIAVALIVKNGLSPTAVLLPAGLLYVAAAGVYRLPIPVQPLKAFGAIAIAQGFGTDEIAAGALLMGVIFVVLGASGLVDLAARTFPRPVIRGVQLVVGLLFLKIAWGLVAEPPASFAEHATAPAVGLVAAAVFLVLALTLRGYGISLVLVAFGVVAVLVLEGPSTAVGPSELAWPSLDAAAFAAAFTALVLPQLPLSFANSCVATADAARTYFGDRAQRVKAGRLATTLGSANVFAGAIGGMPVCHGAGGLTAHVAFGARTAAAPLAIGTVLVTLAVAFGAGLAGALTAFPLPILAALLAAAGILHIGLLRDLNGLPAWLLALTVGLVGFFVHLAVAVALGLALWWGGRATRSVLGRRPALAKSL
jgi:sulfate permease, SulP family